MSSQRVRKMRLDRLLVERGVAESRQKAQALILAGQVLVEEQKIEKCGTAVSAEARVRLLGEPLRYVSRGGLKLEAALDHFHVDPTGKTCLDIGASTGGFTDCLLQHGAARVIAVDAGTNQLDWKIRQDPRVTVIPEHWICSAFEKSNIVSKRDIQGAALHLDLYFAGVDTRFSKWLGDTLNYATRNRSADWTIRRR